MVVSWSGGSEEFYSLIKFSPKFCAGTGRGGRSGASIAAAHVT